VPDIVEVGSQIKVEDSRLLLDDCLSYFAAQNSVFSSLGQ
jgi:hypothetical protein